MTDIVRDPYGNPLKRAATIDALLAENKKLREALEWWPIETAPKNGTTILLSNGTWINFGRWHRHLYGRGSPGWVINDCGTVERITHWMPLPVPPKEGSA